MPYARRTYRRRTRRFRKRPPAGFFTKKRSIADMAQAALSGVRYLKGLVNSEVHKQDNSASAVTVTSDSPGIQHLTNIAQGDTAFTRTGNSIFVRSLFAQLSFQIGAATNQQIRMIFFIDKQQTSDTTPSVTDVLEAATTVAPLEADNVGRFTILRDFIVNLAANGQGLAHRKLYIKMRHHVRYNGAATTDIQKGGIYMIYLSDIAAANNPPTLTYYTRIGYHDN